MEKPTPYPGIVLSREREKPTIPARPVDFNIVYQQHKLTIYRYILARVGSVEDAQDITAQVFLKAVQNAESYRQQSPILYWLIAIARRLIIDHYRDRSAEVSLSAADDLPDASLSPEETAEQHTRMRRVSEALNHLSEDRREAITLRLFAGLSNPEIAGLMGKSTDAVAMLVHRAIHDLKIQLEGEEAS